MKTINVLFPKLLYSEMLNVSDNYNNEIKTEIMRLLKEYPNNKHGESVTNYHDQKTQELLQNPVLAPLFSLVKEKVQDFCFETKCEKRLKICNAWISITYPGQYHDIHIHPYSDMSGVYYANACKPMKLTFVNTDSRLSRQNHEEFLESKKLILFDSSIVHGFVPVHEGSEPKITVAFNLTTS
jgi:hypothetical protein